MEVDLNTYLTALYYVVDEVYQEHFAAGKPSRPGPEVEMADSEVITLAVLEQRQSYRGERGFVAYVRRYWRSYFPRVLSQSAFNRRVNDLAIVLAQIGPLAARWGDAHLLQGDYEVLDGLPIPLMKRCRGIAHRLFGNEAGIGRGGSDRDWYYGVKLVAATTPSGIITGFVVAPANTEERWAVEALLHWRTDPTAPTAADLAPILGPSHHSKGQRQGPTGPIQGRFSAGSAGRGCYLADAGERGEKWQTHWAEDLGASVLTAQALAESLAPQERPAAGVPFGPRLHSRRQIIETVNHSLDQVFGIKFPRARTPWGLFARLAAKVAAHDLAVCLNHLFHRPPFSVFNPFAA